MKKQMRRKEGLLERVKKLSKRKLFKNKVYSIAMMLLGYMSMILLSDCTLFVISLMLGLAIFFARENVID